MTTSEQEEKWHWLNLEQDRESARQWAEEMSTRDRMRNRDRDAQDMERRHHGPLAERR